MKRFATLFVGALALTFVLGLVNTAHAAKGEKPLHGKFESVDGTTVKISSGKKGAETEVSVTTDASTKVTIDGAAATLADLKPGMRLTVTPSTGTATEIAAVTHAKKKGDAGAPATPATPTTPAPAK
jgi:hypothetical protein